MTCHFCGSFAKKFGKFGRKMIQRYRCKQCGNTFSEPQRKPLDEMRIPLEQARRALTLLVEGCGIRAISRTAGLHQETVLALLARAGKRARQLLDSKIRNVAVDQAQVDEVWTFVRCKQKNVRIPACRSVFVAFDRKSKLVLSYALRKRNAGNASRLMNDLVTRLVVRPQVTTDGFQPYVDAVEWAFGDDVDYAQLVKIYEYDEGSRERYSPFDCTGAVPTVITGNPDPAMICTSLVERNNLTMRTFLRRLTRLCLCFSQKLENLKHAVALHSAYYNFCRVHKTLRVTPSMEAGITDHIWGLQEMLLA